MNIKNAEAERLAAEVAKLTGETKTEAVRRALLERRERLTDRTGTADPHDRVLRMLEHTVWPRVPADQLGRRLSVAEEDDILGYGSSGV